MPGRTTRRSSWPTKDLTRTILSDASGVVGADPAGPEEAAIRSAKVLFVDHVGLEGMIRAARVARDAGIPVVADFERRPGAPFDELLALVDHLVVPLAFARSISGVSDAGRRRSSGCGAGHGRRSW